MILTAEQLEQFKELSVKNMKRGTGRAANAYKDVLDAETLVQMEHGVNLPFYLAQQHHLEGKSINQLSRELGLDFRYIGKIFDYLSIPRLSQREASSRNTELGIGANGINPETGRRYSSDGGRKIVELGLAIHGLSKEERRHNSSIGGMRAAELGVGINGIDPTSGKPYRSIVGKNAVKLGKGIHNPENRNDVLPTIHGFRRDVPYNAKSMREANIYRLLSFLGFEIETDASVELVVGESENDLFYSDTTEFRVDFRAVSPKGKGYWYEILGHPFENPYGYTKIRMFQEQNPDKKLIIITPEKYRALERAFAERIKNAIDENGRRRFAGWERTYHSLRTHPEVFG